MTRAIGRVYKAGRSVPSDSPPVGPISFREEASLATDLLWVVQGIVPAESVIVLAASPKASKTLVSMVLGMHVAAGKPFFGRGVQRRDVGYCFLEDGQKRVRRRAKQLGALDPGWEDLEKSYHVYYGAEGHQVATEALSMSPMLLVVDPLIRVTALMGLDENNPGDMDTLIEHYRTRCHRSGASVIIIHHYRKLGDMMRGSTALQGSCDGWIDYGPPPKALDSDVLRLAWTLRDGPKGEMGLRIAFDGTDRIRFEEAELPAAGSTDRRNSEHREVDVTGRVRAILLAADGPLGREEIKRRLDVSLGGRRGVGKERLQAALDEMQDLRVVDQPTRGAYIVAKAERDRIRTASAVAPAGGIFDP